MDGAAGRDEREAVREQAADDLLAAVHHVPGFVIRFNQAPRRNCGRYLFRSAAHQYATTAACSARVYHMLDMIRKAGWQHASKAPSRMRTRSRPAKLLHAAWQASTAPHEMMLNARYLATGTRWMIQLVGYSTIRTVM